MPVQKNLLGKKSIEWRVNWRGLKMRVEKLLYKIGRVRETKGEGRVGRYLNS